MLAYLLAYDTSKDNLIRRDLTNCAIRVFVQNVVGRLTIPHAFS
jgi:hypothetical protein